MKTARKKPLGKSIAVGCILFVVVLCIALGVLNYVNEKSALYTRYEAYITDLLRFLEKQIDAEDMKRCIQTGVESERYQQTLRFMDEVMDAYRIRYLYVDIPLNLNETGNVMCVFSAENVDERNTNPEKKPYLGWISAHEFERKTVQKYFEIMQHDAGTVDFFISKTAWGYDYTGAIPLKDAAGQSYAIMGVDVDISEIDAELLSQILKNTFAILVLGLLFTIAFLGWTRRNVTDPIRQLESGVVDYATRSCGQRDVEALKCEAPPICVENEVKSLSDAIVSMTVNMRSYVSDMLSAEAKSQSLRELADQMSELAVADQLTGVRNKNAFLLELQKLEDALGMNPGLRFGMAMIDLNYLKQINDTFGHEKGDEVLRRIAKLICKVFSHSRVFRVGGDEFAVLIREYDYLHVEKLKERFQRQIVNNPMLEAEPWKHVSGAIGIALYDPAIDTRADDVLKRAAQAMYERKKEMKAAREDSIPAENPRAN